MKYSSTFPAAAFVAAALLLLSACSSPDGPRVLKDRDKIVAAQEELSSASLDLSRVVVVRLKIDDDTREVTSIMPFIVAEARTSDGLARTIFRIDQKTDMLTLFTRDPKNNVAYRADVPVKDPASRPNLVFPILDKSGATANKRISVEMIFAK